MKFPWKAFSSITALIPVLLLYCGCGFDMPPLERTLIKWHSISELDFTFGTGTADYTAVDLTREGYPFLYFVHGASPTYYHRFAWWDGAILTSGNEDIVYTNNTAPSGHPSAFCLDGRDRSHLCYVDSGGDLRYKGDASYPELIGKPATSYNPGGLSIDTDSSGGVYILAAGNSKIYFIYFASGEWQGCGNAIFNGGTASWLRIKVDSNDVIHIVFCEGNGNNHDIHYAYKKAGGNFKGLAGSIQTVTGGATKIALALDKKGKPHIAYNDNGALKYSRLTGSAWTAAEDVHTNASGNLFDLEIDDNGYPHIALITTNNGLLYNWKDMDNVNTAGDWHSKEVDTPANPSGSLDLSLDPERGFSFIFYCDDNANAKKVKLGVVKWTH